MRLKDQCDPFKKPPIVGQDLNLLVPYHPPLLSHEDGEEKFLNRYGAYSQDVLGDPYVSSMYSAIPFVPAAGREAGMYSIARGSSVPPLRLGTCPISDPSTPFWHIAMNQALGVKYFSPIDMSGLTIRELAPPALPYDAISSSRCIPTQGARDAV